MKKVLQFIVAVLALGSLGISAYGCGSAAAADGGAGSVYIVGQNTGISVSGIGRVVVVPDTAVLNMGVQVQAATVAEAQQKAARIMDDVMAALQSWGIVDKDITTSNYSVYPVYDYWTGKAATIAGYSVSNYITVKIRSIDDAGKVIDAAAIAGGDEIVINSIAFTVDNPEQYNAAARELAMADALAKAEQLAELGGVRLGKPAYITEAGGYYAVPPIYYPMVEIAAMGDSRENSTSISPGETTITTSVQVTYNIQ